MSTEQNTSVTQQTDERKSAVRRARRVVLKLGTKVLLELHQDKGSPQLMQLIMDIAAYREKGYEIALVSSGAVGFGMDRLGTGNTPVGIEEKASSGIGGTNLTHAKMERTVPALGYSHGTSAGYLRYHREPQAFPLYPRLSTLAFPATVPFPLSMRTIPSLSMN